MVVGEEDVLVTERMTFEGSGGNMGDSYGMHWSALRTGQLLWRGLSDFELGLGSSCRGRRPFVAILVFVPVEASAYRSDLVAANARSAIEPAVGGRLPVIRIVESEVEGGRRREHTKIEAKISDKAGGTGSPNRVPASSRWWLRLRRAEWSKDRLLVI